MKPVSVMRKRIISLVAPLFAVMTALLLSTLLIAATGRNPLMIYHKMLSMTFGSDYGTGQIVFRTTSLLLTGLAVAIPFRVKLFNIGGEGQVLAGVFAAAFTGILLPPQTHPLIAISICSISAMLAGSMLALLAGWLKVRLGINEVISTIMLNFIAQAFVGYMLTWHLSVPSTVHTPEIVQSAQIPMADAVIGIWRNSPANMSTVLALAACLGTWIVIFKSTAGYEMRAAGLQPEAARYGGINTDAHILKAMAAGGAMAGLVSTNLVLGYKHFYEAGLGSGIGFIGIAVALLAYAHPLWIIPSALLFGFLEYGGLTVNAYVPKDIFMMVQAVTILMVLVLTKKPKRP